jgi:hypothetical protein
MTAHEGDDGSTLVVPSTRNAARCAALHGAGELMTIEPTEGTIA